MIMKWAKDKIEHEKKLCVNPHQWTEYDNNFIKIEA